MTKVTGMELMEQVQDIIENCDIEDFAKIASAVLDRKVELTDEERDGDYVLEVEGLWHTSAE